MGIQKRIVNKFYFIALATVLISSYSQAITFAELKDQALHILQNQRSPERHKAEIDRRIEREFAEARKNYEDYINAKGPHPYRVTQEAAQIKWRALSFLPVRILKEELDKRALILTPENFTNLIGLYFRAPLREGIPHVREALKNENLYKVNLIVSMTDTRNAMRPICNELDDGVETGGGEDIVDAMVISLIKELRDSNMAVDNAVSTTPRWAQISKVLYLYLLSELANVHDVAGLTLLQNISDNLGTYGVNPDLIHLVHAAAVRLIGHTQRFVPFGYTPCEREVGALRPQFDDHRPIIEKHF